MQEIRAALMEEKGKIVGDQSFGVFNIIKMSGKMEI